MITYLRHGAEELAVHHPPGMAPEVARRVVAGLLEAGRVPPPRPCAGATVIQAVSRTWVGRYDDPAVGSGPAVVVDWDVFLGPPEP